MRLRTNELMKVSAAIGIASILIAIASVIQPFQETSADDRTHFVLGLFAAAVGSALAAVFSLLVQNRTRQQERAKRVFLIYSRQDLEAARSLRDALRAAGYDPWLDHDEVLPGQVWDSTIDDAIRSSIAAIVLLSENLQASPKAMSELKLALQGMASAEQGVSPIIPLRLDGAQPPPELLGIAWADIREPGGIERLMKGLAATTGARPRTSSGPATENI